VDQEQKQSIEQIYLSILENTKITVAKWAID